MNLRWLGKLCFAGVTLWLLGSIFPLSAQTAGKKQAALEKPVDDDARVSIEVARERAAVLHVAYAATLDTIHHYYFRREQSVLPARAMEEVFSAVARKSNVKARWIAVNTKPMSVDHEPNGDFEKKAAAELAAGEDKYEAVEDGYFRSASSISLHGGCLSCHANSSFGPPPKGARYAGLVISVPIKAE